MLNGERLERNGMSIELRSATIEDIEQVFKWRNDQWIVDLGTTGKTVSWDEHYAWFKETLLSEQRQMFIILNKTLSIGQVRFDRLDHNECEISIYLMKEHTGQGLGSIFIRNACQQIFGLWDINQVIATIKKDNYPSLSVFKKSGFLPFEISSESDYVKLFLKRSPQVPHNRLTFGDEEVKAVSAVVASGYWAGGTQLKRLETALSQRTQVAYAVGVGSGLGALRLALKGLGIGTYDEVIVPAYSCVALANAVMSLGAKPIPVDVSKSDWNIDPQAAKKAISPHTRAIIVVNTFGSPAAIPDLKSLNLPIIEDCSHALGIELDTKILGNRSDVSILSFYATKLIGGGEGGAILTNRSDVAKCVKDWRDYSDQLPDPTRLNDKMNDLEAALALCQLHRLDAMLTARKQLANRYDEYLSPKAESTELFRLPSPSQNRVWYRYVIEMDSISASTVIRGLQDRGIQAESPILDWRSDCYISNCPIADRAFDRLVSLPLYPTLQLKEQEIVCQAFIDVIKELFDV